MTIVRYQNYYLFSKNDSITIVIENDCHATRFDCRSAQERFAHVPHVNCDQVQDSFSTVHHHVTTFRPQCCSTTLFAATASKFVELIIGNCGAKHGGHT